MKKHFFGFAVFSLIVGTSAFVYSMFNVGSVEKVYTSVDYSNYAQKNSCWKMKRELNKANAGLPTVKQAIFNLETKQLKWELDAAEVNTPIALNFFVKDEYGMRYVNSALVPRIAYRDGSAIRATSSYDWLDNLGSYKNLYVTAEPISSGTFENKNFPIEFDASKATAVLLY